MDVTVLTSIIADKLENVAYPVDVENVSLDIQAIASEHGITISLPIVRALTVHSIRIARFHHD